MGEQAHTLFWAQRLAAASVIGALGGLALIDYKLPVQLPQYYALAAIVVGLGAGVFLDHPGEQRVLPRLLMAMVPAAMPVVWLAHCHIVGGVCSGSGARGDILTVLFMWLALTVAILVGSFAWPLLLSAVQSLTGAKASNTVERATRLVTKVAAFLGAVGLVMVKYPQIRF